MATAMTVNGIAVYPLASGKSLPQWLSEAKKRALKKDEEFRRRIELIQDFAFPSSCHTLAQSGNGRYIVATGTYPPRVRVYDTVEKSMKFERYMDAASVATTVMSDDFTKMAFLQDDRHIEVHAGYGKHHRTRIPTFGRDMAFHAPTAELLVGASGTDVYRLSLEQGCFMAPITSGAAGVNKLVVSRITALVATGCDGGLVQLWDPRDYDASASTLRVPPAPGRGGPASGGCDVTAVAFDDRSLTMAVGTSDGRALLYDMRSSVPLLTKVHQYGLPVHRVVFHRGAAGGDVVLSADARVTKLWRKSDGSQLASIEAPCSVKDVLVASDTPGIGGVDSGLVMMGGDQERVMAYYIPALGLAPAWCSYLDSLTEELEERAAPAAASSSSGGGSDAGVYDDYRFVTRDELQSLGLAHLVGTPLLRAYMHGYFMDARLHARVQSLLASSAPSAAGDEEQAWRKARVAKAVQAARGSRITLQDDMPAVNRELAARLMAAASGGAASSRAPAPASGKAAPERPGPRAAASSSAAAEASAPSGTKRPAPSGGLLGDSRFSALFTNPDFAIDEGADEYARMHPQQAQTTKSGKKKRRDADSDEDDA